MGFQSRPSSDVTSDIRARQYEETIIRLASSRELREGDFVSAERNILEAVCREMGCRRTWHWRLNPRSQSLLCVHTYDQGRRVFTSGPSLPIHKVPRYLEACEEERTLESLDMQSDREFREWREFLSTEPRCAMMHIPIRACGKVVGVLWVEAKEEDCVWTADDRAFAIQAADLLAQISAQVLSVPEYDFLLLGRDRYMDLVNNALDMLFVIDLDGGIVSANPVCSKLLGYSHEEITGRASRQLLGDAQMDQVWTVVEEMLNQQRETCRLEVEIACKDGSSLPVELKLWPVVQNAQVLAVQGIGRDLRERREAEANQDRLERQLFQAQRLESVGRLAGGIAHDFNNILTAIIGSAEIVLATLGDEHLQARHLREVLRSSQRAASLVQHLLAFSRKQMLQPAVLDLNTVLRDLEGLLLRVIGEDVQLNIAYDPNLPKVQADPAQIEQVIVNLAVNARDAMPEGGTIKVETALTHLLGDEEVESFEITPGPYVLVKVADSGCGMDEDTRIHIYEPFFTTKGADGSGTGLGLSMAYGIVKQSGGYIALSTELGKGSEFRVYLPVHESEETAAPEPEEKKIVQREPSRANILLVEDDDALRRLTCSMLMRQGYSVVQATDGVHAMELISRMEGPSVDLLLTDVVMPQMGGPALATALRSIFPNMRVVYMSGYAREIVDRGGNVKGQIPLLQKPFTMKMLTEHIGRALE